MDFTFVTYKILIKYLIKKNYKFVHVEQYFVNHTDDHFSFPLVLIRHDVDRKPKNALKMAKLEADFGIKSTYYFRTIRKTFKPNIIKEIVKLGHEIGYHYENLAETYGNPEKAVRDFKINLTKLRKIFLVKSIAMHGRPSSKWDNRDLWKKYNYKDYGIISEPYFDLDFNKILYITDAGRTWENNKINKRDKVNTKFNFNFKHTNDIINAIEDNKLPIQIMINIHPEHWASSNLEWLKIWIIRKIKNLVKRVVIKV